MSDSLSGSEFECEIFPCASLSHLVWGTGISGLTRINHREFSGKQWNLKQTKPISGLRRDWAIYPRMQDGRWNVGHLAVSGVCLGALNHRRNFRETENGSLDFTASCWLLWPSRSLGHLPVSFWLHRGARLMVPLLVLSPRSERQGTTAMKSAGCLSSKPGVASLCVFAGATHPLCALRALFAKQDNNMTCFAGSPWGFTEWVEVKLRKVLGMQSAPGTVHSFQHTCDSALWKPTPGNGSLRTDCKTVSDPGRCHHSFIHSRGCVTTGFICWGDVLHPVSREAGEKPSLTVKVHCVTQKGNLVEIHVSIFKTLVVYEMVCIRGGSLNTF